MKLTITETTYTTKKIACTRAYLNSMLCKSKYSPDVILEYLKMYPDISIGSVRYYDNAVTLLCSAYCKHTTTDIIKLLDYLLLTYDINTRSRYCMTPLLAAISSGNLDIAKYLVSKGAKFFVYSQLIRSDFTSLDGYVVGKPAVRKFVVDGIYNEVTAVSV